MFPIPDELSGEQSLLAQTVVTEMAARSLRLAIGESLTGGALASAVVDVPGSSKVLLGSIVAYDTALKTALLGVDQGLLSRVGPVDAEVAAQMAVGVRSKMAAGAETGIGSVIGVACTGVAGPDSQGGKPVGLVFIAVDAPGGAQVHEFQFAGDRAQIRSSVVAAALKLLAAALV
jgi:nicotinamide-nucleotide amidase